MGVPWWLQPRCLSVCLSLQPCAPAPCSRQSLVPPPCKLLPAVLLQTLPFPGPAHLLSWFLSAMWHPAVQSPWVEGAEGGGQGGRRAGCSGPIRGAQPWKATPALESTALRCTSRLHLSPLPGSWQPCSRPALPREQPVLLGMGLFSAGEPFRARPPVGWLMGRHGRGTSAAFPTPVSVRSSFLERPAANMPNRSVIL